MPKAKESTKEVVKFDVETAVIVALDTKYKDVQITDGKSYALVMAGIGQYRDLRLAVITGHKEEKQDALEHCNFLDAEKRRILARLAPGEEHLKGIRKAWDDEKERIKAEKEAKEQARKDGIRDKIFKIQTMIGGINMMDLKTLKELSDKLENIHISEEDEDPEYMEFTAEALNVLETCYDAVQAAISTRIKLDQEEADRKAEDERLEKLRKKQEAAQAKIDEENRKIRDEKIQIAKEKMDEQQRKEREEFERKTKEEADKAAKARAQQAEIERERKEKAEEAEKTRKEAARPDREKIMAFAESLFSFLFIPTLKTKEAQEILDWARIEIHALAERIKGKAQEL